MLKLRQDKKLSSQQIGIIAKLYKIYAKNMKSLSILEDNIVFLSMEKKNKVSQKIASFYQPNWQAYKRLDQNGYSFSLEDFSPDGGVHELALLNKDESLPYMNWSENKLEMIYTKGISPIRNILHYDLSQSKSMVIVDSMNDDFSPIYGPDNKSIIFISDRDKTKYRDPRTALYLVFFRDKKRVYKLTDLSLIQENVNHKQARLHLSGNDIIYFNEKGKQVIPISIINSLKQVKSQKKKRRFQPKLKQISVEQLKSAVHVDKEIIEEFKWRSNEMKLQQVKDRIQLFIKRKYSNTFIKISDVSLHFYENVSGPFYLASKTYLFFLSETDAGSMIHYLYKSQDQVKALSDKRENCFAMLFDEGEELFYYVLRRSISNYLVKYSLENKQLISRTALTNILMMPAINPLLMSETKQVEHLNAAGTQTLPFGGATKNSLDSKKSIGKMRLKLQRKSGGHLFSLKNKANKKVKIHGKKELSVAQIDLQLKQFIKKIRQISTNQELNQLKYRYSQLHKAVSKISKDKGYTNDHSKQIRLIRWIETLNGIKILLDQASILMEEE